MNQYLNSRNLPICIWLMIVLLLSGCGAKDAALTSTTKGEGSSTYPKQIRIGYQVSPNGELLAKALGLAEKKFAGVQVKWIKFDAGRDVNVAMTSGAIDFGMVGTPPAANGISQGLPYQIYYIHDVIAESEALIVKNGVGITNLQGTQGHKIATTFGSTSHFSLLSALKQAGINEKSLTILDIPAPEILAAWQRGDIDGAYIWQPTQSTLIEHGGNVLLTSKDVAAKGGITGEVGVVQKEFLSKYPNVVKDYISVLDEAVQEYRAHPQSASVALSKELGLTVAQSLKAMNEIIVLDALQQTEAAYMGSPDKPGQFGQLLKDTGDFLVEQKTIKSSVNLASYQKALRNDLYPVK
ncbi:taurine transport system substrate-binding protein [Paenibacillus shirakamiensis]|uniref:Taurine transport system substrate-binding protein n=1 Tax=Paenibacillus shirakamiensis TaxID=1265935 RepID=A0ABS4JHJ3_9BACL|nr:ABC transporter substrate-binding protein [Paenibacillus shirakamiensis]MBP2001189.1 taurine transport system substrate-binding protein [Paenibacillus shirakamiensis]